MLLPALNSAREKARRSNCQGNLKQIGTAIKSYSINENLNPIWHVAGSHGTSSLSLLISSGELTDYKVYVCPSSTTPTGSTDDPKNVEQAAKDLYGKVSYAYVPGIDSTAGSASGIAADGWATANTYNHTDFGNIMFGDGSVKGSVGTTNKKWINDANWYTAPANASEDWEVGSDNGPEIQQSDSQLVTDYEWRIEMSAIFLY